MNKSEVWNYIISKQIHREDKVNNKLFMAMFMYEDLFPLVTAISPTRPTPACVPFYSVQTHRIQSDSFKFCRDSTMIAVIKARSDRNHAGQLVLGQPGLGKHWLKAHANQFICCLLSCTVHPTFQFRFKSVCMESTNLQPNPRKKRCKQNAVNL